VRNVDGLFHYLTDKAVRY